MQAVRGRAVVRAVQKGFLIRFFKLLVPVPTLGQAFLVQRSNGLAEISEEAVIVQEQLVRSEVLHNPWKDRPLRQIVEGAPGGEVKQKQIVEITQRRGVTPELLQFAHVCSLALEQATLSRELLGILREAGHGAVEYSGEFGAFALG